MIIFSIIGGFVVGVFLGIGLVYTIEYFRIRYHSKKECRECLRTRIEYGFHVDGKEYKCIEK